MNTKESTLENKTYVLTKSSYNTLLIILSYTITVLSLTVFLTPLIPTLSDREKLKTGVLDVFVPHVIETIKLIHDLVPLKDNILTALGTLVLALFINVRSENKEADGKPGYEISVARAYKTFSDIIIYILGFIMFINFWAEILLGGTINSNDQTYPWVSLFFMLFIIMINSLEGDSEDSLKKQILQTQWRISVIKVHTRTSISPKDSTKYNDILYHYEPQKLFLNLIRTASGYIQLKYSIINKFLKVLLTFLFTLYIFYTTRSIARISYFPSINQDCTLKNFIQYFIQVFHQVAYITCEDLILVGLFSIIISIIFIFFNIIYQIYSTRLNLHSEENFYGYILKIIYWAPIGLFELSFLATLLLYIISDSVYTFSEVPLFICTLITLIIGYIIINNELTKNYTQKLNQDLGLPENQSLNETKTSAELYYLNTKLKSLYTTLETLLEETQISYTRWKNSSNINSDNIDSSCE